MFQCVKFKLYFPTVWLPVIKQLKYNAVIGAMGSDTKSPNSLLTTSEQKQVYSAAIKSDTKHKNWAYDLGWIFSSVLPEHMNR